MSDLVPYVPPQWAKRLSYIPEQRCQFAHLNTPIQAWHLNGVPDNFSLSIKRDDMTGSVLSGNKDPDLLGVRGNLLLDRLSGAHVYMMPKSYVFESDILPRMEKFADQLREERHEEACIIPLGGSNHIGMFGYIMAFEELMRQGVLEDFDDIVVTCGSGGTITDLSIANYLTGSKIRCHGISVREGVDYYYDHMDEHLTQVGLHDVRSRDIANIIVGHVGEGHGESTPEEMDFLLSVASTTGIVLDPCYTAKAAMGLLYEMNNNPERFKGNRILFIHTGGIFGLYGGVIDKVLSRNESCGGRIVLWKDGGIDFSQI